MNLSAHTHVCPAFLYFDAIAACTACSISASGKTINGAFPPSSFKRVYCHYVRNQIITRCEIWSKELTKRQALDSVTTEFHQQLANCSGSCEADLFYNWILTKLFSNFRSSFLISNTGIKEGERYQNQSKEEIISKEAYLGLT